MRLRMQLPLLTYLLEPPEPWFDWFFHFCRAWIKANNDDWRLRTSANMFGSVFIWRPTRSFDVSMLMFLMANRVLQWVPRGKQRQGLPGPKRGKDWSSLPRIGGRRAMPPGQPGQLLQSRTAQISENPHAAEEALKQRRTAKLKEINQEGKKTLGDCPSCSPFRGRDVTKALKAKAKNDSNNGVPVPTPPVIPEPNNSEKHVPVPTRPEAPEPKKSEQQVPVSTRVEVVKEEKN